MPQRPSVFYIGVNNGGVRKTNDYGRICTPIFDDQPTGSIGAIAPSDPNVVYVGSGDGCSIPTSLSAKPATGSLRALLTWCEETQAAYDSGMSRAARKRKSEAELQDLSLDELNAELKYLRARKHDAGASITAKLFAKEIATVETVRLKRFGVEPRRRGT